MNKCILIGRVCSEIELRKTQTGLDVCFFSVAINNGKDKQGNERPADFIKCRAWREKASFISKWFQKGKMIAIEGTLRTGSYQDRNHPDVTHYTTEVFVDNVEFCGDKGNAQPQQQAAPQYSNHNAMEAAQNYGNLSDFEEILSDGDVPF